MTYATVLLFELKVKSIPQVINYYDVGYFFVKLSKETKLYDFYIYFFWFLRFDFF